MIWNLTCQSGWVRLFSSNKQNCQWWEIAKLYFWLPYMVFSSGRRAQLHPVLTQGSSMMEPPPPRMLPVTRAGKWGHMNHAPALKDFHWEAACSISAHISLAKAGHMVWSPTSKRWQSQVQPRNLEVGYQEASINDSNDCHSSHAFIKVPYNRLFLKEVEEEGQNTMKFNWHCFLGTA